MSAADLDLDVRRKVERDRMEHARLYQSPAQLLLKIDAMIVDCDSMKIAIQELTFGLYSLRGAINQQMNKTPCQS